MKFLCQIMIDETVFDGMSEEDHKALQAAALKSDMALRDRGVLIRAQALQPPERARTVSVRQGRTIVTDGPYAEAKEHLGGIMIIEAADMAEAIRVVEECPMARVSRVEIRPVMNFGLWA